MSNRYAVRKVDTESEWFNVVDLTRPRAALCDPAAVVARYRDNRQAAARAAELNTPCSCCLGDDSGSTCDGCVTGADVGCPEYGHMIAHAHPACPVHGTDTAQEG